MLWRKVWFESRVRFFLAALTLVGYCSALILYNREISAGVHAPSAYVPYIWEGVYKSFIRELFVIFVLLLGMGGLLQERKHSTAGFSLSLPVSRWQLVGVRAAMGFAQVGALSLLPALVVPGLSSLVHQSYPLSQALQFSLLWTICGGAIFALGFLASVIFSGSYTAPIASLIALTVYSLITDVPFLERYSLDIHDVMSGNGMSYFRPETSLLTGPLPWLTLTVISFAAFCLVALAGKLTSKQDF